MKFIFPEPVKKKTVWIELPVAMWTEIESIQTERHITQEQIINTFLTGAWEEYQKQKEVIEDIQKSGIIEKVEESGDSYWPEGNFDRFKPSKTQEPKKPGPKSPLTPEEQRARKKAYQLEYYKKHPEKFKYKKKVKSTPVITEVLESPPAVVQIPYVDKTQDIQPTVRDMPEKPADDLFDVRFSKNCIQCGELFYKRKIVSRKGWEKAKSCSQKCNQAYLQALRKARGNFANGRAIPKELVVVYANCSNANCPKPYGGKFVAGTGVKLGDLEFCNGYCESDHLASKGLIQ